MRAPFACSVCQRHINVCEYRLFQSSQPKRTFISMSTAIEECLKYRVIKSTESIRQWIQEAPFEEATKESLKDIFQRAEATSTKDQQSSQDKSHQDFKGQADNQSRIEASSTEQSEDKQRLMKDILEGREKGRTKVLKSLNSILTTMRKARKASLSGCAPDIQRFAHLVENYLSSLLHNSPPSSLGDEQESNGNFFACLFRMIYQDIERHLQTFQLHKIREVRPQLDLDLDGQTTDTYRGKLQDISSIINLAFMEMNKCCSLASMGLLLLCEIQKVVTNWMDKGQTSSESNRIDIVQMFLLSWTYIKLSENDACRDSLIILYSLMRRSTLETDGSSLATIFANPPEVNIETLLKEETANLTIAAEYMDVFQWMTEEPRKDPSASDNGGKTRTFVQTLLDGILQDAMPRKLLFCGWRKNTSLLNFICSHVASYELIDLRAKRKLPTKLTKLLLQSPDAHTSDNSISGENLCTTRTILKCSEQFFRNDPTWPLEAQQSFWTLVQIIARDEGVSIHELKKCVEKMIEKSSGVHSEPANLATWELQNVMSSLARHYPSG